MSESRDRSDQELIAQLRDGLDDIDPVPGDVAEFARAAFGWRQIDAELAGLTFDSEIETPAAVRSTTTTRMLSFAAGERSLDLEYDPATGALLGQLTPEESATVELRTGSGTSRVETDDHGRFAFDAVEPGPVSLIVSDTQGTVVIKTEWTVL